VKAEKPSICDGMSQGWIFCFQSASYVMRI